MISAMVSTAPPNRRKNCTTSVMTTAASGALFAGAEAVGVELTGDFVLRAADITLETASQDGVHEQRCARVELTFPRTHDAAFRDEIPVGRRGITAQPFGIDERQD